jgi:YbgC/YbaW family acyl-CoA thioester hydrolase
MSERTPSTPFKRQDFAFLQRQRVRWCEVDQQKIVYSANYLMYLDNAVTEYWRAAALPYEATLHDLGGDFYVKKAGVEYHRSARYDDTVDIGLRCTYFGNSSMRLDGAVFRADELLATGELLYVFADPSSQTSRPIPAALRQTLQAFDAGQPMVEVRRGDWQTLGADASRLRTEVFVQEQRIPIEMEWDDADATALHAVAYNRMGRAVATGRLLQHAPGVSRIGRMATDRVLRGAGLGRMLVKALCAAAAERSDHCVMLHAQRSAEAFYLRLGFTPVGEPFDEAGIVHIEMQARPEMVR